MRDVLEVEDCSSHKKRQLECTVHTPHCCVPLGGIGAFGFGIDRRRTVWMDSWSF